MAYVHNAEKEGLTQGPELHGDVHVAVLGAVVHGLLQGLHPRLAQPHLPLAGAALAGGVTLHPLSQDLLQGQHIPLGLLGLAQELAQDVPEQGQEVSLTDKGNFNNSDRTMGIWD